MYLIEQQNQQLFHITEQNMEDLIINEEKNKLFDIPINKYKEKYSHPPIFKRIGKIYTERRKNDKHLMRKRIKSNFYKKMKNKLHTKFQTLGVKEKFDWPQNLVTNITKSKNRTDLDTPLGQLLLENDILIYQNNKDILQANKLDCIFEAKIKDLFNEYIDSEQFQSVLKKMIDEEESYEYIHNYINFKALLKKKIYLIINGLMS